MYLDFLNELDKNYGIFMNHVSYMQVYIKHFLF